MMFVFILEHIYPLVATRETSDIRAPMYSLLYHTLLNNWQYFFKSTIAGTGIHYSDSLTHLKSHTHSPLPYSLTSLTHSHTSSLLSSLIHLLTYSLTYSLSLTHLRSHSFTRSLTHSISPSLTHSLIHSFSQSVTELAK